MATGSLSSTPVRSQSGDPTARDIIASARRAPAEFRPALLLCLSSALALWASFTPVDFGPLAWVALLPLLQLVRLSRPTRRMSLACFLGGLAFWLPTLQWMRLGDPTMYVAWWALSVYLALYWPIFIGLTRIAVWRWKWPLMLAAPVVWTGLELVRNHALTGFGWYALGHSQYRWLNLIQISDLFGAYGVSFLVMLVSAALAELWPVAKLQAWKLLPPTSTAETSALAAPTGRVRSLRILVACGVCLVAVGYGQWRRTQTEFIAGPRIAAVQGNYPASAHPTEDPNLTEPAIFRRHMELTGRAVKMQPDVILWPEGMLPYPVFTRPAGVTDEQLIAWTPEVPPARWDDKQLVNAMVTTSAQARALMIVGGTRLTATPTGIRPLNAAFGFDQRGYLGAYDKLHLVPYGEYLPLKDFLPFLGGLTPYRGNFGLEFGTQGVGFDAEFGPLNKGQRQSARLAPIICFEDTVPHVVRRVLRDAALSGKNPKPVDVLVNLTNDGWFKGSSEHDQHLVTAVFRCVEFRTPMVRAVNTGISAIIDGDGQIRERALDKESGKSKWTEAVLCDFVPLDRRQSLYLAGGDWFAGLCGLICLVAFGQGLVGRWLPEKTLSPADSAAE